MPSLQPAARLKKAEKICIAAAKADKPTATQHDNGDEALYPEKWGSYSKGLAHDAKGDVRSRPYNSMLRALKTGAAADFDKIGLGGTIPLVDPQAGLAFTLEGRDPQSFELPAAPPLASAWRAGEAVEAYWMALLRDVPYSEYETHPSVQAATADISKLSDFRGPTEAGKVTAKTLFRGFTPGDLVGPYVSQFLLKPLAFGALKIDQTFRTYRPELDYMTEFADWLTVQNGQAPDPLTAPTRPFGENVVGPARYLRDGRGLSAYVHADISFEAYLNACLVLLTQQPPTPFNEGNPYRANMTQAGFVTFGSAYAKTLISSAAALALNIHAKTRKLWKHSALRLAGSRTNAAHQFTNRPLMNSVCPAEMSIALSRAHLHAHMHVASCWRRVHHRDRHQHTIPIALAALPGAILPATSCIGAFRTPAPRRVDSLVMPSSKTCTKSRLALAATR